MNLSELAQLTAALAESGFRERFKEAALVFSARLKASLIETGRVEGVYDSVPALTDEIALDGRPTSLDDTWVDRPSMRQLLEAAKVTAGSSAVVFLDTLHGQGSFFENAAFVGRGNENDVRLRLRTVSASHAMLTRSKDGWVIRDLDSTNGTYLGGKEIGVDASPLTSGSWLSFGPDAHALFLSPSALYDLVSKLAGRGS